MLAAASDGKLVYTVGGTNGTSDLTTVETYDPATDKWATIPGLPQGRSDFGVAIDDATVGGGRRQVRGTGPQERRRTRSHDGDVDRTAGHGQRAPRLGGRLRREDGVRDRRVDGCRRRPGHGVGRSAEAGTTATPTRSRMAGATGCADRQADDGVDRARRRDLDRRRHARRRNPGNSGELRRPDGSVAEAAAAADPSASCDGGNLPR